MTTVSVTSYSRVGSWGGLERTDYILPLTGSQPFTDVEEWVENAGERSFS